MKTYKHTDGSQSSTIAAEKEQGPRIEDHTLIGDMRKAPGTIRFTVPFIVLKGVWQCGPKSHLASHLDGL
jgi:hypothetical protein